jgi:hypothetical protein
MDRKREATLILLHFVKQAIIETVGFSLQTIYESVCAAAHPKLRVYSKYALALALTKDPEIDAEFDDNVANAIADIVCTEVEQLTPNLVTKTIINDPGLESINCELRLLELQLQSRK